MPVTNDEIYAYLVDLSANIAKQFAQILDAETENFITLKNILNLKVIPGLTDLSANIAEQFAQVNNELELINFNNTSFFLDLNSQLEGVSKDISNQTNDINTNTNTALSQYTDTINTNTNESVSTAVSILNH